MNPKTKLSMFMAVAIVVALFSFSNTTIADTTGQSISFFTNPKFDYTARSQITATLYAESTNAYFYLEDGYFANLGLYERINLTNNLNQVIQAFDGNIYPKETAFWGPPGSLGASNGQKVTILLERLSSGTGGYFDSNNEYPPELAPTSNYRPMITISIDSLNSNPRVVESLIAHEFQHLISFNQKDLIRSVDEDIWLNELRSEYSVDLVGYNEPFRGSTLQQRIREFIQNPSDSLTEWLNQPFEYGAISLFGQYLVDQYGPGILKDTMQTSQVGITSINDYLIKRGYQQSFKDLFENWAITNYLNSNIDPHYSYSNADLKDFHISPSINNLFYPFNYTYTYSLKPWQPLWLKFNVDPSISKSKVIKLEFQGTSFDMAYVDDSGHHALSNLEYLTNMPQSFVLIPYNQSKTAGFTNDDPSNNITINLSFVDVNAVTTAVSSPALIPDGALIKKNEGTDLYVITGPYKRYMSPEVIALYGQLDPDKAIQVTPEVFDSFPTSNYIRVVNTAGIYAVWSDNTKHLFNFNFIQSGRDPKLIFTINPREFDIYKTGVPILR